MSQPIRSLRLIGVLVCLWGQLCAQTTFSITGVVTDARTGEPLAFVNVVMVGKTIGTITDERGRYALNVTKLGDSLAVQAMGYALMRKPIMPNRASQAIDFALAGNALQLAEVVVRAGENPAFNIIRQVRKNRNQNDWSRLSAYECDSYLKTETAISHMSQKMRSNPLIRKIDAAMRRQDSLVDEHGQRLLPILVSESVSRSYFRRTPTLHRDDMRKSRIRGIAVDDAGLSSQLLGSVSLTNQNFYENYIPILGKDFASPTGENWRYWYDFYLADTVQVGLWTCYELHFEPKRPEDLAFIGKAWIDTTSFALCQIDVKVDSRANINYVRQLEISQESEPITDTTGKKLGSWLPTRLELIVDLMGIGKQSLGLRTRINLRNSNLLINRPHPVGFYEQSLEPSDTLATQNDAYWRYVQQHLAGEDSLNTNDHKARRLIDTLRQIKAVRTAEAIGQVLVKGFYTVGGFDIGPYPYLFAINSIEGLRTRLGFRTNETFSKKLILRAYGAYGTYDQRFKYGLESDYIFSRKRWMMLGIRYVDDLERLGLTPELIGGNRMFYALSRFGRYRGAYRNQQHEVFLTYEPIRGIMLNVRIGQRKFSPLFPYQYRTSPELGDVSPLATTLFDGYWAIEARLARKEKYLMDGNERIMVGTKKIPVFTIRYTHGAKSLGGNFSYDRLTMRAQQILRMGPIGRMSYLLTAGWTPSTVPALLLFPHIGNPTPLLTVNTFNRMQFYEFVSDRYVAIHLQHKFEGLLFNRLPLVRKFNWRLMANFDALWGSERPENHALNSRQRLPGGQRPIRFGALNPNIPYMEVGYGIDNIFKIIRIQAVHRLTYLQKGINGEPVEPFTIKAAASISF